jgi:hypothetical protein
MGVSLKTENEEHAGKTSQIRSNEGGRRGFTGTCQQGLTWRVPRQPSARLTHGLKLATAVWLLRCSVFRETPIAFSCNYFKRLNHYHPSVFALESDFLDFVQILLVRKGAGKKQKGRNKKENGQNRHGHLDAVSIGKRSYDDRRHGGTE